MWRKFYSLLNNTKDDYSINTHRVPTKIIIMDLTGEWKIIVGEFCLVHLASFPQLACQLSGSTAYVLEAFMSLNLDNIDFFLYL